MIKYLTKALIIYILLLAGCAAQDEGEFLEDHEMSAAVSDFLLLKFGGQNRSAGLESNIAGPANNSFNSMLGNFGFGGGRLDSADADTIIYDDPWEWKTCAEITTLDNPDGSTTEVYDYGDGCFDGNSELQYWMFGKYTSTFKNDYEQTDAVYSDNYFYNVIYDNYGGTYYDEYLENKEVTWLMNGYSNYSGFSIYDEETGVFTGEYEYESESIYEWDEAKYYSKNKGSSKYGQDKFIVDGFNEYESINSPYQDYDYYKSNIISPLVYDYSCYQNYYADDIASTSSYWFFAYVSGTESIEFRENGLEGAFTIDYGNGACDNLVTITENGMTYEIDLVEFYQNSADELSGD